MTEQFNETFESKFPELSKKSPWTTKAIRGTSSFVGAMMMGLGGDMYEKAYGEGDISETCLSRSRVLEKINMAQQLGCNCNGGDCAVCYCTSVLKDLKEELGLIQSKEDFPCMCESGSYCQRHSKMRVKDLPKQAIYKIQSLDGEE